MNTRNEIKSYIIREGMTMSEVVEKLAEEHGWSSSVPNLSGKLRRGSLRYREVVYSATSPYQLLDKLSEEVNGAVYFLDIDLNSEIKTL